MGRLGRLRDDGRQGHAGRGPRLGGGGGGRLPATRLSERLGRDADVCYVWAEGGCWTMLWSVFRGRPYQVIVDGRSWGVRSEVKQIDCSIEGAKFRRVL